MADPGRAGRGGKLRHDACLFVGEPLGFFPATLFRLLLCHILARAREEPGLSGLCGEEVFPVLPSYLGEVMVQEWGSAGHRSKDDGASPQEWGSISPGIREHCSSENHHSRNGGTSPQGEFMPPGIEKHHPREINHSKNGKASPQELGCITPGMREPLSHGDSSPPGPHHAPCS